MSQKRRPNAAARICASFLSPDFAIAAEETHEEAIHGADLPGAKVLFEERVDPNISNPAAADAFLHVETIGDD